MRIRSAVRAKVRQVLLVSSLAGAAIAAINVSVAAAAPSCPPDPTFTIAAGEPLIGVGTCTGLGDVTYTFVVYPSHGSLSAVGDGDTVIYTPDVGFAGTDTAVIRAADASGGTTDRTVTVIVLAPSGPGGLYPSCPDPVVVFVPLGATVRLYAPCRDPEGQQLTYVVGNTLIPQSTYNPDGLKAPDYGDWLWGSLVLNVSIDYDHNALFGYAEDSFEYTASDGFNKARFDARLKITNPADPPIYSTAAEATATEPFTATVQTSASGTGAAIAPRDPSTPPPPGYFFFGQEYAIQAAAQTVANPLKLTFVIDSSRAPQGDEVDIFRNGSLVPLCTGAPSAVPDPCVASRGFLTPSGDYEIVVLTSQASVWNTGTSVNYPFSGFLSPVDGLPVVNGVKSGRAIPVKFSLGADEGLGILAAGSPSSRRVVCPSGAGSDEIESTVADSSAGLKYDALSGTYTYVWKTSTAWGGTCRRLSVALDDGTTHDALFAFR